MLSAIYGVLRVTITFSSIPFSITSCRAAAMASYVLPQPAGPVRITRSMCGSSRASSAIP